MKKTIILTILLALVLSGCGYKYNKDDFPNATSTPIVNNNYGNSNALYRQCCYPSDCPEAIDNPENCDCIYMVECGTTKDFNIK